jgi:hypothetical protein
MFVWSKWKKIYVFEVRKEENFTWSDVVVERGTKWEMNEERNGYCKRMVMIQIINYHLSV